MKSVILKRMEKLLQETSPRPGFEPITNGLQTEHVGNFIQASATMEHHQD